MGFESTALAKMLREGPVLSVRIDFDDFSCPDCGSHGFIVQYHPFQFRCVKCDKVSTEEEIRSATSEDD